METIKILTKKAKLEKIQGYEDIPIADLIERLALVETPIPEKKRTPCTYIGLHKSEPCGQPSVTGICRLHKRWHKVRPCERCGRGCLSKINICKKCGYANEYYKQRRRGEIIVNKNIKIETNENN